MTVKVVLADDEQMVRSGLRLNRWLRMDLELALMACSGRKRLEGGCRVAATGSSAP